MNHKIFKKAKIIHTSILNHENDKFYGDFYIDIELTIKKDK